jgi:hypothetical protein
MYCCGGTQEHLNVQSNLYALLKALCSVSAEMQRAEDELQISAVQHSRCS